MVLSRNKSLYKTVLSAMFLALCQVLPLVTAQIPQIGNMLCPMHIPVMLCSYICGPWYAMAVGFTAPLLRFLLFSVPPLIPKGIAMSFELATYGLTAAVLRNILPKKKPFIYVSLIGSMLSGRIVWGVVRTIFYGMGKSEFGLSAFISGGFVNAAPGIILQIILVPLLVITLEKFTHRNPDTV